MQFVVFAVIVTIAVAVFEYYHNAKFKAKVIADAEIAKEEAQEVLDRIEDKFRELLAKLEGKKPAAKA